MGKIIIAEYKIIKTRGKKTSKHLTLSNHTHTHAPYIFKSHTCASKQIDP